MCFAIAVISSEFRISFELRATSFELLAVSSISCHPEQCAKRAATLRPRQSSVQCTERKRGVKLFLRSCQFLLGRGVGSAQDAEDFIFFHDDELFAVDLDLGAGVLAEQDAVAFFNGKWEGLAFVVGTAFAGGDDFALLRLVFGRVGNDDAAAGGGSFFHTTHQNAVM